jgi:hypothetical protein
MRSSLLVKRVRSNELRHLTKEDIFCVISFVLMGSVLILDCDRYRNITE